MSRTAFLLVVACTVLVASGCTDDAAPPPIGPSVVPGAPAWQRLAASPSARTEVAAAVAGGRIYVAGGYTGDGATVATVEVFDPGTNSWSAGPELPEAVNHAMATTVDGRVYVFGGYRGDGAAAVAAYRLGDDGWQRIASLPEGRAAGTAVAAGTTVYVAGGVGPERRLADRMLVYDASTDRWSSAPGPPTAREHLGGAGFGGKVYTVGGRTSAGNLAAFEVYDPATRVWTALPDLPTPRGGLAAAASCSGQVVAVGGEAQATFPEVETYDIRTNSWRALPPLPTPRHGLGVVTMGSNLYVLAGGPRPGLHVSDAAEALDLTWLGPCPS